MAGITKLVLVMCLQLEYERVDNEYIDYGTACMDGRFYTYIDPVDISQEHHDRYLNTHYSTQPFCYHS